MRALLVALLLAPAFSGCLNDAAEADRLAPGLAEPPALPALGTPVMVSDRYPGAEPVVAVAPDGTVYFEGIGAAQTPTGTRNMNLVWKSIDDGATWVEVTPPGPGRESSNDGYLAVGPDGAVYVANVFGLTFQVFRSDDAGASWVPLNVPRVPLLMHRHWITAHPGGLVHVTLEALDPGAAPVLVGGPTQEQLPATPNRGFYHFFSRDRGDTWSLPQRIDDAINYAGQSNMATSADGERLYVMRYTEQGRAPLAFTYEDGEFYLLSSEDGGATWQRRDAFALGGTMGSALTSLALDAGGVLSFVWSEAVDGTSRVVVATSNDGGASWSRHEPLAGSGSQAMPFAAPLGPGRLGLVWYEADRPGLTGEIDATWRGHYAEVAGVGSADAPVAASMAATSALHEGGICVAGPACGERGGDRRLLDYPWLAYGADGLPHMAFASTLWGRPSAFPVYVGAAP